MAPTHPPDPTHFLTRQRTLTANLHRITTHSLRSLHPLVDRAILNVARALQFFRGLKNQRMTQAQREHLGTLGDRLFYLAVEFERGAWGRWYKITDKRMKGAVMERIVELERKVDRVRRAVEMVWRSYHLEVREEGEGGGEGEGEGAEGGEDAKEEEEEYVWWSDDPGE